MAALFEQALAELALPKLGFARKLPTRKEPPQYGGVRQTEAGQPDAGSQTSPGLAGRGDGFPPDHHAGPKPDIRIWTGP